jgi:Ca-activated chloride channel homolog
MTTTDAPLAQPAQPAVAGQLRDSGGQLPLVAAEIDAEIRGLAATTIMRQTFRNTRTTAIEATYIFPLPDRAAVTAFTAELAGRRVEAELRERAAARAEYDAAIAAGHRAAITEEERADVFSVRVGNLQPGEEAVITLTLTGPLAVADGQAEYRFPLVVAPRYVTGQPLPWPPVGLGIAADTDAVPDASRVTPPVLLPGQDSPVRLSLRARLAGLGLAPGDVRSTLHALAATDGGDGDDGAVEVALRPGERLDRDVVLCFGVAQATARPIATVAPDDEDPLTGTWQVTIVPPGESGDPALPAGPGSLPARDVVVVLDRSGSMGGWKIVAARRAAARIVDSLAAQDRFAVLAFDNVVERPPGPGGLLPASDSNRWAAVSWLARLEARGGTEMLQPLVDAAGMLAAAAPAGADPASPAPDRENIRRERFLVLVTDGQIAGEDQILGAVSPLTGDTRIFALGIDQAVNAGFLRRLAELGAGRCELAESEDRLDEVMVGLHRRISPPLVTGLRVEAAEAELLPGETAPSRAPDLFPGVPCTLSGRWRATGPLSALTLTVHGDGEFRQQVVARPAPDEAVRACWARARVRDLEDRYAAGAASPELAGQIVAVSLRHRVLSRFTAFVAVDRSRSTELGSPQPVIQPVEQPRGWAAGLLGAAAAGSARRGIAASRAPKLLRGAGSGGAITPTVHRGRAAPFRPAEPIGPSPGQILKRAAELFDRIRRDLDQARDLSGAARAADEMAEDLSSLGGPGHLIEALRRLASALRSAVDPEAALDAARESFRREYAPGEPRFRPVYPARGAPPDPAPRARREWWR